MIGPMGNQGPSPHGESGPFPSWGIRALPLMGAAAIWVSYMDHACPLTPNSLPAQAFQRLVYVSQLIFGDQKAAFLLPWRRHFTLTEAQLFVARRDNAKAIFRAQFEAKGGDLIADR